MPKVTKERRQEIKDLQTVMGSPEGRRFVWRQLEMAGVFLPCYNAEAEGGRRVGLALLQEIITETPGDYLRMQNEQISQETRKRIERETKTGEDEDEKGDSD